MKRVSCLSLLGCLLVVAGATQCVSAATLFQDTFNRDNNRNIDASLTGITDNTGSSLPVNGVYTHAYIDPANDPGPQDGDATNGGGAQILNNQLQLAVGAGTSNAFVNHNFINSQIMNNGNFTVSLDITGFNQTGFQQGGAFAVGMSAAEAASAKDAFNLTNPRMTFAFHDTSTIGTAVPVDVVSDFWLALRGNSTLVWGGNSGNIQGVTGLGTKTGTISANFQVTDFNAGSTVNYEVFLNGISRGTGSFVWSGTNENYIGIDARDNTAVSMDNFSVTTVPEPASLLLVAITIGAISCIGRSRRRTKNLYSR